MIKNDSNFMVNNFLLINVDDDAIYLAKSKQDVLNYWKEHYGTPMELVGETDEEFLEGLRVLDLDSEEAKDEESSSENFPEKPPVMGKETEEGRDNRVYLSWHDRRPWLHSRQYQFTKAATGARGH